jgi:hypothetical protein
VKLNSAKISEEQTKILKNLKEEKYKPSNKTRRLIKHKLSSPFKYSVEEDETEYFPTQSDDDEDSSNETNIVKNKLVDSKHKDESKQSFIIKQIDDSQTEEQYLRSNDILYKKNAPVIAKLVGKLEGDQLKLREYQSTGFSMLEKLGALGQILSNKIIKSRADYCDYSKEMVGNIDMLIEINFLQLGTFTIFKDTAFLLNQCGNAIGDVLINRDREIKYENKVFVGISRLNINNFLYII